MSRRVPTKKEWNEIVIPAVNAARASPPPDTDCEPLDPIDLYPGGKAFRRKELKRVQNAVKELCPDIEFVDPPIRRWPQTRGGPSPRKSYVDEILEQLELAWCDCEDEEPPCEEEFHDEFVTIINASEPIISEGTGLPSAGRYNVADLVIAMPESPGCICVGSITKVGAGSPSATFTNEGFNPDFFICGWPDCEVRYNIDCAGSGGGPGGGGGG